MRTLVLLASLGLAGQPAAAETLAQALQRFQDRFNAQAFDATIGEVDFEFRYVAAPEDGLVLLEEPAAEEAPLPDSLALSAGVATPKKENKLLPADLSQVDAAALKARLQQPLGLGDQRLYLAVAPAARDERFPGERLSLADSELSAMERRHLRWEARQLVDQWPGGSVLVLEYSGPEPGSDEVEVPVRWSVRRPGLASAKKQASSAAELPAVEIVATGEQVLPFRKAEGQWKMGQVQKLVALLREKVPAPRQR